MSRVFITGSSDGLGLMAGQLLAANGHSVTLHARNQARAGDTRAALPQAASGLAPHGRPGRRGMPRGRWPGLEVGSFGRKKEPGQ